MVQLIKEQRTEKRVFLLRGIDAGLNLPDRNSRKDSLKRCAGAWKLEPLAHEKSPVEAVFAYIERGIIQG